MFETWAMNVPVIEEWVTLRSVARSLKISRQQAHLMAMQGKFKTLRRLDADGRPAFVLRRSELEEYVDWRAQQPGAKRGPKSTAKQVSS